MAFHALADYQTHVIGWLQWEQSSLGDGAVVRFPRIWMSSGECRFKGLGVEKSLPHAYMWTTLALDRASGKLKSRIEALRNRLGDDMSPLEIAEAIDLASDHRLVMGNAPASGVLASRLVKQTSTE